jgi:F-type H+-transporting ATPase subunit gamma
MEATERLQRRIDTLDDLHGIVRTMKTLSAVSIRQYESASDSMNEYYRTVKLGLYAALSGSHSYRTSISGIGKVRQSAAIIFGSDHGLCGRFNDDILAFTLANLNSPAASSRACRVLTVGTRLNASLEESNIEIEESFLMPGAASGIADTIQQLLLKLDGWLSEEIALDLRIFYNFQPRHRDGTTSDKIDDSIGYKPKMLELLPVDLNRFQHLEGENWPSRRIPTFSMDKQLLLSELLRQYFFVAMFRACAESQLCEHATRLKTMQSAQKNLEEKLDEVTSQFRRVRQEAITTELLDVISGFEAIMKEDSTDLF